MTTNDYQWLPMTAKDYQWLTMTSNYLQWPTDWLLSADRIQLCSGVRILRIYQGHQEFPQTLLSKKTKLLSLIVAWLSSDIISCFKVQSSIGCLVWFFDNGNSIFSGGNSWCLFSSQQLIPYQFGTTFWLHSGFILATFRLHSSYILTTFWQYSE